MKQENDYKETKWKGDISGYIKKSTFWWIVSILGVLFLGAITCAIVGLPDASRVMKYIEAFSVLLSILLSIFAIQYTYNSNNEIYRQFDKINGCAENINTTNRQLTATQLKLDDNIVNILSKLDSIKEDIKSSINSNEQKKTIENVEEKFNELNNSESQDKKSYRN